MIRYVNENKKRDIKLNKNKWWESFDENVNDFKFLFISSFFKNTFQTRLQKISDTTNVSGAALNSVNLLLLAEGIKSKRMKHSDLFKLCKNDEINISLQ